EQPMPVVVSPKVQLQVAAPTPPAGVLVKLTAVPSSLGLGLATDVTTSFAFTVTEMLVVAVTLTISVAVTLVVNVPWLAKAWVVMHPVPVVPSPKVQLQVATPTPLVACAVTRMTEPTSAGLELAATETVNFALTVSETLLVAVTPRPSIAVTSAVN